MRPAILIFAVLLLAAVTLRSADEPATPPAVEAPRTQPAAQMPTTQPVAEMPTTQPAAEVPATQPASLAALPPATQPARPVGEPAGLPARIESREGLAPPPPLPASGGRPTYDTYRLISERNIFSKDRTSRSRSYPRYEGPTSRPAPPSPPPEPPASPSDAVWVLAGVGIHREAQMAFLENTQTGEVLRLTPGCTAASGTIASICLDSVEYCCGQATRTIRVGENLAGQVPTPYTGARPSFAPAASAGGDTPSAASQPATTSDPGVNAILERMRQRRLQEQGK